MKLSAAFFALASADICGDCDGNSYWYRFSFEIILAHIADFNAWHGQSNIVCSRYQHPRDLFVDARAACKECKVQCVPNEETCPGTDDLAAGFWNKTALKLQEQYIKRAESKAAAQVAARLALRSSNKLQKEQDKYNKMKQKMEEKQAKAENKAAKKEDYAKWREEKRAENEARRAAAKQAKKEAKAAAKAAKEEAKVIGLSETSTEFYFFSAKTIGETRSRREEQGSLRLLRWSWRALRSPLSRYVPHSGRSNFKREIAKVF